MVKVPWLPFNNQTNKVSYSEAQILTLSEENKDYISYVWVPNRNIPTGNRKLGYLSNVFPFYITNILSSSTILDTICLGF